MRTVSSLLAVLFAAAPLGAQVAPPKPTWITEFGVLNVASGPSNRRASPINTAFWEVGYLAAGSSGLRWGGTAYASYDDTSFRRVLVALKLRARATARWGGTADLSAGPIVVGDTKGSAIMGTLPGFTARLDLGFRELVGVVAGVDVMGIDYPPDYGPELPHGSTTLVLGVRVGSWAGIVTGPLAAIGIAVAQGLSD